LQETVKVNVNDWPGGTPPAGTATLFCGRLILKIRVSRTMWSLAFQVVCPVFVAVAVTIEL
jgi:hypothetical protein